MRRLIAKGLLGNSGISRNIIQPILNFGFRFYVAFIFFKSGLTKVDEQFIVTEETKALFEFEYKVPLLSSDVAAYLATYAELFLPILLVIGFLSRPAAIGLFILNTVAMMYLTTIEFAADRFWQHAVWAMMLSVVIAYGPSKFSLDSWISKRLLGRESNLFIKVIGIIVLSAIGYLLLNKYL